MKLLVAMLSLFIAQASLANNINWNSQAVQNIYKSIKNITLHLDDKKFVIPSGTEFKLFEVSELSMIKVHLHKYKINNCPSESLETDLELVSVAQPNGSKTSVGVNLTRECNLEIFVDMKEYNSVSFLK